MNNTTEIIEDPFTSTHALDFETGRYPRQFNDGRIWQGFRIGTCQGLWCFEGDAYLILAVVNSAPGNGHFTDVLDWFKNSCQRDHKSLKILELWNNKFKQNLIQKHGFKPYGLNNLIWSVANEKSFNKTDNICG